MQVKANQYICLPELVVEVTGMVAVVMGSVVIVEVSVVVSTGFSKMKKRSTYWKSLIMSQLFIIQI